MKRLLLTLSLLAILGWAWGEPIAARACSGGAARNVEEARAFIGIYDLVIIGAIAQPRGSYVEIDVETVYKGPNANRITLNLPSELIGTYSSLHPPVYGVSGPDCRFKVFGDPGERYFLAMDESTILPGAYEAGPFSVAIREATPGHLVYAAALSLPSGGGPPSVRGQDPSMETVVLIMAGSLMLLSSAVFAWRRSG